MMNPNEQDPDDLEIQVFNQQSDISLKIVILGNVCVGKTNIISRYIKNEFSFNYKTTLGVDFHSRTHFIHGLYLKEQIWDTAGEERYQSISGTYLKNAKGVLIIYDITNRDSFTNLDFWIDLTRDHVDTDTIIFIVGNKLDLEHNRQVDYKEASDYSESKGHYF